MYFFPTSLSAAYWHNPRIREKDEDRIAACLRRGDTFVDVGANLGALSLRAATVVGPEGRVHAIEPHPVTFDYLRRNVELNGLRNISMHNTALGAEQGIVHFTSKLHDDQNQASTGPGIEVKCTTLDELLGDAVERVDLLKVDVEGFELFVLQGAARLLAKTRVVYFESCEEHFAKFGYSTRDVVDLLMRQGFVVHRISGEQLLPVPAGYVSLQLEDLLARREPAGAVGP